MGERVREGVTLNNHACLSTALQENNLILTAQMQQQLEHYLALLQKWNKVFNLTAICDPREMVYLHIIDSLVISPYLHGSRMLDVGSGAGLPGLPLAILHPEQQWTLLDKSNKKTRFLTQAVIELDLPNVTVHNARCEEFHSEAGFDSIVSRAWSDLSTMLATIEHVIAPTGVFIAMKSAQVATEIALLSPRFSVQAVQPLQIKGMAVERYVVILKVK